MIRALIALCLLAATVYSAPLQIRVATFNASLNRTSLGQLASDLSTPNNNQAKRVAEIIQRVAPDILLVNEFDYEAGNATGPTSALMRFHDNYLAISQNGQAALNYPYRYIAPTNTGLPTGVPGGTGSVAQGDFDNNGTVDTTPGDDAYGNDCFGFGQFPGQYSFAVYSKFPILTAQIRTFQLFLWKDMPGASLPDLVATPTPKDWYTAAELSIFRLSSKNHVDLPIELTPGHVLHLLTSHPTPPSFDAAEDRNGNRNYDEIRFWADYINNATYIKDDTGTFGGLGEDQRFIILGDMNADPLDGDSKVIGGVRAINQLRNHFRISSFNPSSPGGTQQKTLQGGVNLTQQGDPAFDTSFFSSGGAGNLRVDHILPSKIGLSALGGGVFWPLTSDPTYGLLFLSASQTQGNQTTDHRMVWTDFAVVPIVHQAVRDLQESTPNGSDILLAWKTQNGVTYKVECSADLLTWNSSPEIPIQFDSGAMTAAATDVGGLSGLQNFYRILTTIEAPAGAPLLQLGLASGEPKKIVPIKGKRRRR